MGFMNLYQLASQIKPESLKDRESKVIWKSNTQFAYLFKVDGEVYLRLSGSQFQCLFYIHTHEGWLQTNLEIYKEIVSLWQDEKADRI